jgi:endothelin-converting enzyme/putative endopeptidase
MSEEVEMPFRPNAALVLSLACVALPAGAQHGIDVTDIRQGAAPCNDFFDYANGQWRASHPIPGYMDRWSKRWESGETNKANVRAILDEVSARQDWAKGSAEQLSGDFYGACMAQDRIDAQGLRPIRPLLDEIKAIGSRAGVQRTIGHLHDIGIAVPFGVSAQQDLHDPTRVIAQIDAGGLGLPDRDYYVKTEPRFVEARDKYRAHVARMFELAGATPKSAKARSAAVFAFEKRLALASLDNVAMRDPAQLDHKTTFAELTRLAPDFGWSAYFDAAGMPRGDLNVAQPKFVRQVDRELKSAPLSDWRAYLEWQVLNNAAESLSTPFSEENFAFNGRYLTGASEMKPRWKRCAEAADNQLGDALGRKFVERHFPPQAKARMQEMVRNLLLAMGDSIRSLDWMSQETQAKALEKLASFNPKIGYPDKWKDYAGVAITRDSYWGDVVAASRWNVADQRRLVGQPVDRSRWGMTPPTSNAYYNPFLNEIVFPAGILQPPGFDMNATDAVNYGAIGVVIGHEITHGFDDQGAQFDAQGALRNWWTPADKERFQARAHCVARQFDGYFIEPGLHHNGALVLGESIADLGGAKIALRAYRKSREGKGPEATIDGFTPEQQFFLAWGQWRGDETRPEAQRKMIQGDEHPVAKYRVIGPLSNLPAFGEAFQCKADDAMVRQAAERCEVW